jgi:hypothetical protein
VSVLARARISLRIREGARERERERERERDRDREKEEEEERAPRIDIERGRVRSSGTTYMGVVLLFQPISFSLSRDGSLIICTRRLKYADYANALIVLWVAEVV